jgi:outer membrane protein assembly factor BamB
MQLLTKVLRPYGGTALVATAEIRQLEQLLRAAGVDGGQFQLESSGGVSWLFRPGPLPNAGQWTHQYGNAAQTGISTESRARAPLGVLWFGGPSNDNILPRHGHGPAPQVAGGRIVVEGPNLLRALDVYTGRLLWELELPDVGKFYDETKHMPGAGEIGSNYVTLPDSVYVVYGKELLRVDAVTGEIRQRIPNEDNVNWGYLGVSGDTLLAGSSPLQVAKLDPEREDTIALAEALVPSRYASGSRRLVAMNRHTGERLWSRDARHNFRHNAIALSDELAFVIDRFSDEKRAALARRGVATPDAAQILAIDLKSGEIIWEHTDAVFGTFLSYSAEHDLLVQAGSLYRDRAYDEVGKGMITYAASTGDVVWHDPEIIYRGPCLLWKDKLITNGNGGFSLDLLTGKPTGWTYQRKYGCNTAIGCQTMLTFRSGAAGYYDLLADAGTSNLGGFRSSCTNNLIPADGLLCAPDYTRTCNCAYQNQTSVAFIHEPLAEQWSFGAAEPQADVIGLNFGAPGDRRSASGTLWLDTPSVGGESPDLQVTIEPKNVSSIRVHPAERADKELPWVYASAIEGVRRITINTDRFQGDILLRFFFADLREPPVEARQLAFSVKSGDTVTAVNVDSTSDMMREVTMPATESVTITFDTGLGDLPFINGLEIEGRRNKATNPGPVRDGRLKDQEL